MYPSRHGLSASNARLSDSVMTLATQLAASGFATAAIVNSDYLSQTFGLDRGFQKFRYVPEAVTQREPSHAITDQALAWARELRRQRWFLFVHYYDVHSDYCSLPEYESQFVRPYAGAADGTTEQMLASRQGRVRFDAADVQHLVDLYDAGIRQMDDEGWQDFSAGSATTLACWCSSSPTTATSSSSTAGFCTAGRSIRRSCGCR